MKTVTIEVELPDDAGPVCAVTVVYPQRTAAGKPALHGSFRVTDHAKSLGPQVVELITRCAAGAPYGRHS